MARNQDDIVLAYAFELGSNTAVEGVESAGKGRGSVM